MDQVENQVQDEQSSGLQSNVDNSQVESNVEEHESEKVVESTDGESHTESDKFDDPKMEAMFQKRLARSERKLEKKLQDKYSGYRPDTFSNQFYGQQHYPQPHQQYQQSLSPDQQELARQEQALNSWVDQRVNQVVQQKERQSFYEQIQEHSAKDEDYDDFMNYELPKLGNKASTLLELSKDIKDPRILFDIYKSNPIDFKKLAALEPIQQAMRLGEFRGKRSVPTRKTVSSAPEPIQDINSRSAYQKPDHELDVSDRIARKRAEMRSSR
jgi:hypothetical protein